MSVYGHTNRQLGVDGGADLLVLGFDKIIVNGSTQEYFVDKKDLGDADDGVTEQDIDSFIKKHGILHEGEWLSFIREALDRGKVVRVAEFTKHPKAIGYVLRHHLGLSEEEASQLKVIGGFPDDYHQFDSGITKKQQRDMAGKNFHIVEALVQFVDEKGFIPEKVLLADSDQVNVNRCIHFHREARLGSVPGFAEYYRTKMKQGKNPTFFGVRVDSKTGPSTQLEASLFGGNPTKKQIIVDDVAQNVSGPLSVTERVKNLIKFAKEWLSSSPKVLSPKQLVDPKPDRGNVESNSEGNDNLMAKKQQKHSDAPPRGLVKDSTVAPVEKGDRQR